MRKCWKLGPVKRVTRNKWKRGTRKYRILRRKINQEFGRFIKEHPDYVITGEIVYNIYRGYATVDFCYLKKMGEHPWSTTIFCEYRH
jgi:uncharacterized phage-associated protein